QFLEFERANQSARNRGGNAEFDQQVDEDELLVGHRSGSGNCSTKARVRWASGPSLDSNIVRLSAMRLAQEFTFAPACASALSISAALGRPPCAISRVPPPFPPLAATISFSNDPRSKGEPFVRAKTRDACPSPAPSNATEVGSRRVIFCASRRMNVRSRSA